MKTKYSISRIGLNIELQKQFKKLKPGLVLDVGSDYSPYKKDIPHTKYLRMDINEKTNPDICCDIHEIKWESNYFDTVVATEVLEHLYNPQRAINEVHRILKNGGVCIFSTRFIYPYHATPKDYYRFTQDSLNYLFREFKKVEIFHHGNRLHVLWQLISIGFIRYILNLLNPLIARIHFKKTNVPCGFVVYAEKGRDLK